MVEESVDKDETIGKKPVIRPITSSERGQPRLIRSNRFVRDTRKVELEMPRRLCVFDNMMLDDAVFNSVDVSNLPVLVAMANGKYVAPKGASSAGKVAADFLNYNIRNMSFGTWMEYINNANTDIIYGWSFQNIVTEIRNHGKFRGFRVLKKLAPRNQKSLYGWVFDKNNREVLGFVQKPNILQQRDPRLKDFVNGINNLTNITKFSQRYPFIRKEQILFNRYNPTDNNPQGDSPLMHCYDAWLEKKLVERFECIGVTKDMGGAVVLRVPSSLIERANDPQNYPDESAEYKALQEDAAALQAGESSFILLASDVDPVSKVPDFNIDFKGIDGGGKQYNTSDIIDQKRKSIYNVFGAGFLLLGQNSVGSYALSTSQTSTHGFYVQRNIMWKTDVLNNQLAPTLLAINNINLNFEDMPVFQPSEVDELSLDELGKFLQRAKSVGALTKQATEHLYDIAGLPTDGIDELDFSSEDQSRSGESFGSSGNGKSDQNNSDTNMENKSLVVDSGHIVDIKTGLTLQELDKNDE